ncbi:hypothetical protein [Mythimna sequax nucleopolyhedrovirus]|nr:hypothetical protein [Mythimna sequax nucleopolyhedrovirus]
MPDQRAVSRLFNEKICLNIGHDRNLFPSFANQHESCANQTIFLAKIDTSKLLIISKIESAKIDCETYRKCPGNDCLIFVYIVSYDKLCSK